MHRPNVAVLYSRVGNFATDFDYSYKSLYKKLNPLIPVIGIRSFGD
jgi:hypothetical protein